MANQELLERIEERSDKGTSEETVRAALVAEGWSNEDVNGAFAVRALSKDTALSDSGGFVSNHPYRYDWFSVCCILIVIIVGSTSVYAIYMASNFPTFSSFVHSLSTVSVNTVATGP